jgi:hypothetical protein
LLLFGQLFDFYNLKKHTEKHLLIFGADMNLHVKELAGEQFDPLDMHNYRMENLPVLL